MELRHTYGSLPGLEHQPGEPDSGRSVEEMHDPPLGQWESLPDILTPKELPSILRVSRTTVYEQIRHGALGDVAFRLGRRWLIDKKALRRLIEGDGAS